MSYSFTEKKRIRKSFAKRPSVLEVPSLLETQLHSYHEFLQADVPAAERRDEGLQGAFKSIFPIVSHNGLARLDFQEYILDDPVFDVSECQLRGLNYCSRLRAKVRLVIFDRDQPKQSTVKEIRESEVYMGEIPLMTKKDLSSSTVPSALLYLSFIVLRVYSSVRVFMLTVRNYTRHVLFHSRVHGLSLLPTSIM